MKILCTLFKLIQSSSGATLKLSYTVVFDLSKYEWGSQHVSRCHACLFCDSELPQFAIEVIGRNGCTIRGVSYLPGSVPIKLNSQDLIEIAGIKFYFLLPYLPLFLLGILLHCLHTIFTLLHPENYPGHPSAGDCGLQGKLVKQN